MHALMNTQDVKVLQHVLRRHETYYILLHVAGVCVFHTLNVVYRNVLYWEFSP
jgi:hypothetical protein